MNFRDFVVALVGISSAVALAFFPPWKAHGVFAGHFRIDRVAFVEFDTERFFLDQGASALATVLLGFVLRKKRTSVSNP